MIAGRSIMLVRESGRQFEEQQLGREPQLFKKKEDEEKKKKSPLLQDTHPSVQIVTKPA